MTLLRPLWLVLTIISLVACGGGSGESSEPEQQKSDGGKITLSFTNSPQARIIQPNWTEIKYYDIQGTGPDGATFEVTDHFIDSGEVTVSDLASGEWTLQVVATDLWGRDILGGGETVVVVKRGMTTDAEVIIKPYTDPGTLTLDFSWVAGYVAAPRLEVDLVNSKNETISLDVSMNANGTRGSYTAQHDPGYYTLTARLYDGVEFIAGYTEVVRIITGLTSQGDRYFDQVMEPIGDLRLSFINKDNPYIKVNLTADQFNLKAGESVVFSAALEEELPNAVYKWYRNGLLQESEASATYTITSHHEQIEYVTVVVASEDGSRYGDSILRMATTEFKFALPVEESSGWPREFIQADMDGDGDQDLVAANINAGSRIFWNDEGAFSSSNIYGFSSADGIDIADMNGDGHLDIIFAESYGEEKVSILLNQTDGTFQDAEIAFDIAKAYRGVRTADLDSDGDLDVIVTGVSTGVVLFINNGDDTFTRSDEHYKDNVYTSKTQFVDMNGDGFGDIVLASHWIYFNDGAGNFTEDTSFKMSSESVAVADLDNDGDMDLAASGGQVYLNDGAGTFTKGWNAPDNVAGSDVATADVNNDGYLDLLLVRQGAGSHIYLNKGDAIFKSSLNMFVGQGHAKGTLGDFDQDGDIDVVVGDRYSKLLQIYEAL